MITSFFRFLSSVWFAFILILSTAIFVIVGTFLEAKTASHEFAEHWIYHHTFFKFLLGGYFINIFFSSLSRWPFQKRHIPFLLTHLGLLMVISGVFFKSLYGIQGHLYLIEGASSDLLTIPHEKSLLIEEKFSQKSLSIPINKLQLSALFPHGEEKYAGWMDKKFIYLLGHKPLPLSDEPHLVDVGLSQSLKVFGRRNSPIDTCLEEIFGLNYEIHKKNKKNEEIDFFSLKSILKSGSNKIKAHLKDYKLFIEFEGDLNEIPLTGYKALLHRGPYRFDLEGSPFLLVHQNGEENITTLVAGDAHGRLSPPLLYSGGKENLIAYDGGFLGYGMIAEIPFYEKASRHVVETLAEDAIKAELKKIANSPLTAPLEIIRKACLKQQLDFPEELVRFLSNWADQKKWLYHTGYHPFFPSLDWGILPSGDLKALYWIASLIDEAQFVKKLRLMGWPLLSPLEEIEASNLSLVEKQKALYLTWMHQIYTIREELPEPLTPLQEIPSEMLSALFRLYGLHYTDIPLKKSLVNPTILTLETHLQRYVEPQNLPLKQEDATPLAIFLWKGESIPLIYNSKGKGLKWPTREGSTLLRFQPHKIPLPYEVKIHQARDIKYPGTDRTLSYECTLSLKNKKEHQWKQHQLRMNQVHETAEGYRFYLAGMGTIDRLGVHAVQLVVSKDPAKAFLTYPGGLLVAIGVALLFWKRYTNLSIE